MQASPLKGIFTPSVSSKWPILGSVQSIIYYVLSYSTVFYQQFIRPRCRVGNFTLPKSCARQWPKYEGWELKNKVLCGDHVHFIKTSSHVPHAFQSYMLTWHNAKPPLRRIVTNSRCIYTAQPENSWVEFVESILKTLDPAGSYLLRPPSSLGQGWMPLA